MYTQCPECHSTFRVTAKLLQQAAGTVRCGECGHTFSALTFLSEDPPEPDPPADNTETAQEWFKDKEQTATSGVEWQAVFEDRKQTTVDIPTHDDEPRYDDDTPLDDLSDDTEDSEADDSLSGYYHTRLASIMGSEEPQENTSLINESEDWSDVLEEVKAGDVSEMEEALSEIHSELSDTITALETDFDSPAEQATTNTAPQKTDTAEETDHAISSIPGISGEHLALEAQQPVAIEDNELQLSLEDDDKTDNRLEVLSEQDEVEEAEVDSIVVSDDSDSLQLTENTDTDDDELVLPDDTSTELEALADAANELFDSADEVASSDQEPSGTVSNDDPETPELSEEDLQDDEALNLAEELENKDQTADDVLDDELSDTALHQAITAVPEDLSQTTDEAEPAEEIIDKPTIDEEPVDDSSQEPQDSVTDGKASDTDEAEPTNSQDVSDGQDFNPEDTLTRFELGLAAAADAIANKPAEEDELLPEAKEETVSRWAFTDDETDESGTASSTVSKPEWTESVEKEIEDLLAAQQPPPATSKPQSRALTLVSVLLLALLLIAQVVHQSRAELSTNPAVHEIIEPVYDALGLDLQPDWDITQWQFLSTRGNLNEQTSTLNIVSSIGNREQKPMPYPLLHIALTNRWEDVTGSRILTPEEYLNTSEDSAGLVPGGATINAEFSIADTDADASGFKLSVCYPQDNAKVRCATQGF